MQPTTASESSSYTSSGESHCEERTRADMGCVSGVARTRLIQPNVSCYLGSQPASPGLLPVGLGAGPWLNELLKTANFMDGPVNLAIFRREVDFEVLQIRSDQRSDLGRGFLDGGEKGLPRIPGRRDQYLNGRLRSGLRGSPSIRPMDSSQMVGLFSHCYLVPSGVTCAST